MSGSFTPYEGDSPYIYASYSRQDKDIVLPILKKLNDFGIRIWYDKGIQLLNPWRKYNAQHIKACYAFVLFMSKNYNQSEECQYEINDAVSLKKQILPIYLEEMPHDKLNDGLRNILNMWQAVFFYKYKDNLDRFFNEIQIFAPNLNACKDTNKLLTTSDTTTNTSMRKALKYYVDKDFFEAARIFKEQADLGDAEAMRSLGCMYLRNEIAEGKQVDGISWLSKAGDNGSSDALNQLGLLCHQGEVLEKNLELASQYFRRAADAENTYGMCNLANMILDGETQNKDYSKGVELLRKAADKGNCDAMNQLGDIYYAGEIVNQNLNTAKDWYKCAADHGNANAMYNLANMYLNKEFPDIDPFEGVKWLEQAAQCGHSQSMNLLGIIVYQGKIAKKDIDLAIKFFKDAAKAGNHWGSYNLAKIYLDHRQTINKGLELLRDSAEKGNANALYDLSQIYRLGRYGITKNQAQADYLENLARESGYNAPQTRPSFLRRILSIFG